MLRASEGLEDLRAMLILVLVSFQNLCVETWLPTQVLRGVAFRRWLGHKGCAFMNGISAFIKEMWQVPFASSTGCMFWNQVLFCSAQNMPITEMGFVKERWF